MEQTQADQTVNDSETNSSEPQADTAYLYDFLYRDLERIASYYAQLFSGRLLSLEETRSEKNSGDTTARVNVAVAGGEQKWSGETQTSFKRSVDPHDQSIVNVLEFLLDTGRVNSDIEAAPHGSLILAAGTVSFIDHTILKLAASAMSIVDSPPIITDDSTDEEAQAVKMHQIRMQLLADLSLPSAFTLYTEGGLMVGGTVKESGMQEPINTYYFRHGSSGLKIST